MTLSSTIGPVKAFTVTLPMMLATWTAPRASSARARAPLRGTLTVYFTLLLQRWLRTCGTIVFT